MSKLAMPVLYERRVLQGYWMLVVPSLLSARCDGYSSEASSITPICNRLFKNTGTISIQHPVSSITPNRGRTPNNTGRSSRHLLITYYLLITPPSLLSTIPLRRDCIPQQS